MKVLDRDLLTSAKSGKKRVGKGQLIHYLTGGRLFRANAIKAKCYDCNGMGESNECDIVGCPLYPFSPYKA